MKKYCNLFVLCILLTFFSHVYGQARVDSKPMVFAQKSGKLSGVKGWRVSPTSGKWISHLNYIGSEAADPGRSAAFNWLQMGSIAIKGEKYFVWYYEHPDGFYKYPALQQEWITVTTVSFVVMDLVQYRLLLKGLDKEGNTIIPVIRGNTLLDGAAENKVIDRMTSALQESVSAYNIDDNDRTKIFIDYQTVEGKKVVRFDPTGWVLSIGGGYFETDPVTFRNALLPLTDAEKKQADSIINIGGVNPRDVIARYHEEKRKAAQAAKDKIENDYVQSQADKARQDALDYARETEGKIKDWQTSDTLFQDKFAKVDPRSQMWHPFTWMAISSFSYEGEKKYCVQYEHEMDNGRRGNETMYVILDQAKYESLKDAVNKKDGSNVDAGSVRFFVNRPGSTTSIKSGLYNQLFLTPTSTKEECLSVSVSSKKVKLMLRERTPQERPYDFDPKTTQGYYECDIDLFSRLLKFL